MSRLFFILFSTSIILMSSLAFAEEGLSPKKQVIALYKNYRDSLKAGDTDSALEFAEQMYALTPESHGKKSKTHATATFNLAQMNELLRHYKDSAKLYQEHIDILDAVKSPQDERYLGKLGLMSKVFLNAHETDKAIKYGKKALKLAKDLKMDDETLGEFELNLGSVYSQSYGQAAIARRHINKAYELFSKTYGESHLRTAQALFMQAKLNTAYKKHSRAAEKYEQVLGIYNKELGPGHERILQVHAFLVGAYEKLGKKDKATEHCIAVATERPLDFDRDLDPLYKVRPEYPINAQRYGKSGHIIAEFTVDEMGQVIDIKTLEGKNVKTFEKEAHKALSKFRYAPTIRDGKRVETKGVQHKVTFKIG